MTDVTGTNNRCVAPRRKLPPAHRAAVARLQHDYAAIPPGSPVRLAKRTSNLFRFRGDTTGPALDVLKRHAWLGDKLPWVFLVLAVWRIGTQFTLFLARTRPIYLLVAVIAGGVILYQGSLGGKLVYGHEP